MTTFTTNLTQSYGVAAAMRVLTAPFRAVGSGLIWMAENSSQMKQVEKLHAITDAELKAAGTNRADEIKRIFAACGCV